MKMSQVYCLLIERLTYEDEMVVEYTSTIARGDKFTYSVELNNLPTQWN